MTLEETIFERYTAKEKYFAFPELIPDEAEPDRHTVSLVVGAQSFKLLCNCEDAKHADWMRRQLATALMNVVREMIVENVVVTCDR
jgi:hypothetical protein